MRVIPLPRLSALFLAFTFSACADDCGPPPVEEPEGPAACDDDDDCASGRCEAGLCAAVDDVHGGGDAGPGGPPGDGGVGGGVLSVSPSEDVELGAQLIGFAVTVDITLTNVGSGSMKLLAVLLDDDTGEFSAEPSGTMSVELAPNDSFVVQVTHTPTDGEPDSAELKVLHDGAGNITTISLFAEFKGDAELSATGDLAVITPSLAELAFGEVETGSAAVKRLWLRNTGSADSILNLSDLTLTPPTAGFTIVDEPSLPLAIGAWSRSLCPSGSASGCPPGTAACTDSVCVDDEGEPLGAVALDLSFVPGTLPSQAILTLEHDEGGVERQTDILLTGMPTQPDVEVTPADVDFGPALVGAPLAPERSITLANVGAGPLLITKVIEPADPVFAFDYSRPVPQVDGDPALRIDPGVNPLEVTVTFTPAAAEGYTAFLRVETNDGDELQLAIAIEGTGVVCQANAHVDVDGLCACDDGFIACGAECRVPGATACGDACVDCTAVGGLGAGTVASCGGGGSCEYSCGTAYYDVNNGSDGEPGGASWDGCEYLCPRYPAWSDELCNGVDDTCNGAVDEGLPVDASEGASNNNVIARASVIGGFSSVQATTSPAPVSVQRTLYPVNDTDWIKVTVGEGDGSPSCAEEIPCIEGGSERYRTDFEVVAPAGQSYTLEVFVPTYFDETDDGATLTGATVSHNWTRSSDLFDCTVCALLGWYCYPGGYGCGFDDYQTYYVRVKPAVAGSFSCKDYTLKVTAFALP